MIKSVKIGNLLGIPIRVDITFLLIGPLFAWLIRRDIATAGTLLNTSLNANVTVEVLMDGMLPWVLGIVTTLGLFVGITLHELGHSLVAMRYDAQIDSITLWMFGGIAQIPDIPRTWHQEFIIAIAGPFVSFALGVGAYTAMVFAPTQFDIARFLFGYLALMNVAIAGFNLLPGFPMDGGRVLRALLARTYPYLKATLLAVRIGKGVGVFLALIGLFLTNILYIGIAVFIYIGAVSEAKQTVIQDAFQETSISDLMTPVTEMENVTPRTSLAGLLERMGREYHKGYPVMDDGHLVGMVTIDDVTSFQECNLDTTIVDDIMYPDPPTISVDSDAISAISTLQRSERKRLPVIDETGEVVGVLSRADLRSVARVNSSPDR